MGPSRQNKITRRELSCIVWSKQKQSYDNKFPDDLKEKLSSWIEAHKNLCENMMPSSFCYPHVPCLCQNQPDLFIVIELNSHPPPASLVWHICVSESCQLWFRKWLVAYSAPSHYLNQCWIIYNWTLTYIFQWNFNQNTKLFIHENASENIICEMAAILSRRRWVKSDLTWDWSAAQEVDGPKSGQRERGREREGDRQTDIDTDTDTGRKTERQRHTVRDRDKDRNRDRDRYR